MSDANGNLSLPFFHRDRLVVELLTFADATRDDAETQDAAQRAMDARDALKKARAEHAAVARVKRQVPPRVLADLQATLTRAEQAVDTLSTGLWAQSDKRLRKAKTRRGNILTDFLARPLDVDPISDRLDKGERVRRLEALDPEERRLMLTSAAREGTHAPLLRAALTHERPPWPTDTWKPFLDENAEEEIREWVFARADPETIPVTHQASWRLRRLSYDLDRDAKASVAGVAAADLIVERAAGPRPMSAEAPPRHDDRAALVDWLWRQRVALAPTATGTPTPGREFEDLVTGMTDDLHPRVQED